MSGSAGSPGFSGQFLSWLIPASSPVFDPAHVLVRKSGHVLAYALLGALDFRAVRGASEGWTLRWSIIAAALAIAVAILDEWHQSMVPMRTGSAWDVLIDFSGITLAQVAYRVSGIRDRGHRRAEAPDT